MNYPNLTMQQGWECPKCGHVYSPTKTECTRCPIPLSNITGASTSASTYAVHQFEPNEPLQPNLCVKCGLEKWRHPNFSFTN